MVPASKWQVSNLSLRNVNKDVVKSSTLERGHPGLSVTCILTCNTRKKRGQCNHKAKGWRCGHKPLMA